MARCFNTVGPCNAAIHYLLPTLRRLPEVHRRIEHSSASESSEDDLRFIQELGLVLMARAEGLEFSNPLYREMCCAPEHPPVASGSDWSNSQTSC
ncbi:MAG TPA: hypothetical protein VE057_20835 [Archangium sp.]|nr:hypothetical protein [Archangium sp.]